MAVRNTPNNNVIETQAPRRKSPWSWLLFLLGLLGLAAGWYFYTLSQQTDEVEVLTREGVITQIQELSRLQTITFGVDTVITSQKKGTWQSLWQDEQKGLFVAHGRVNAGVDLNKLTAQNVTVTPLVSNEDGDAQVQSDADLNIAITLPPAEIFDVYLDDIDVYDLQTGLFGIMKTDPAIFEKAQDSGKQEVLKMACKGEVLQMATDNAQKQVAGLFGLTGAQVTVTTTAPNGCNL